ncbi:MAG TPA: cytochrome c oxidase subunit II [Bryobacteraceae bacterium]|nr:cytochrome c oxidase subunit II [Bryobacteraceae bacterium]
MSRITNGLVFFAIALMVGGIAAVFDVVATQDWVQRAVSNSVSNHVLGRPVDWELNFQYAGTAFERDLLRFHNLLFGVDLAICSLVAVLVLYSVWRFRRSRNAVPSQRTHNTTLEILWTVVPVAVLAYIAVPSFALVYRYNVIPSSGMTLKVTGHQWYWEYQYPTNGNLDIISTILPETKLKSQQGQHASRLFAVDNYAVLPVGTVIRIEVTGADVIHSFMVPSLGLQKYAMPGRINEIWTKIDREGDYYGQCSQLCGQNHAFMPIGIRAVSKKVFAAWVESQKQQKVSLLSAPPKERRRPPN